ncbi:MAG: hypothetical protein IAF00_05425 [Phycisphaerales bacterium]|nr:hypothetical protein [Phycisphaerales bacterium]
MTEVQHSHSTTPNSISSLRYPPLTGGPLIKDQVVASGEEEEAYSRAQALYPHDLHDLAVYL